MLPRESSTFTLICVFCIYYYSVLIILDAKMSIPYINCWYQHFSN